MFAISRYVTEKAVYVSEWEVLKQNSRFLLFD